MLERTKKPLIIKVKNGSGCLNHLKHGGTANTIFLPNENPDDFFALLEDAFAFYQPATHRNAAFVANTALARWFLLRRQRAYDNYEYALCLRKPNVLNWTGEEHQALMRFDGYKLRAERALTRALEIADSVRRTTNVKVWRKLCVAQTQRYELGRKRFHRAA